MKNLSKNLLFLTGIILFVSLLEFSCNYPLETKISVLGIETTKIKGQKNNRPDTQIISLTGEENFNIRWAYGQRIGQTVKIKEWGDVNTEGSTPMDWDGQRLRFFKTFSTRSNYYNPTFEIILNWKIIPLLTKGELMQLALSGKFNDQEYFEALLQGNEYNLMVEIQKKPWRSNTKVELLRIKVPLDSTAVFIDINSPEKSKAITSDNIDEIFPRW